MIKRIRKWMEWRGVTVKDLAYAVFALGSLVTLSSIFIYACTVAILG